MIKAIPTEYGGVTFRSRLEARVAELLDENQVRWLYEVEGFILEGDVWYLPDFWLPDHRVFLEVKGVLDESVEKPVALARAVPEGVRVFLMKADLTLSQVMEDGALVECESDENHEVIEQRLALEVMERGGDEKKRWARELAGWRQHQAQQRAGFCNIRRRPYPLPHEFDEDGECTHCWWYTEERYAREHPAG
jgi:hypothetical protein